MEKEENKKRLFLSFVDKILQENKDIPIFEYQQNKPWILYGKDNLYPNYLIKLYLESALNKSIIDTKINLSIGSGFYQIENKKSPRTDNFILNPNPNESLNEIGKKLFRDLIIFGICYFEVKWSRDRKSIPEIYYIDASKIRWGKFEEIKDRYILTKFYYSNDWKNYRKEMNKPIIIPIFNPDKNKTQPTQIYKISLDMPGINYYSLPSWYGGVIPIETDIKINDFHLNNLINGLNPFAFFKFPVGETTEDQRKDIKQKIIDEYGGTSGKKGVFAFYETDSHGNKPEVETISVSDQDKLFNLLDKRTQQKILMSHQLPNENLVGISTPGKLGSTNEILNYFELYYNFVIKGYQNYILKALNRILLFNGMNEIGIERDKIMDYKLTENILKDILSKKELRQYIGEEPDIPDELKDDENVKSDFKSNEKVFSGIPDGSDDDEFEWVLGEEKPGGHCPACLNFSGQIKTLGEWKKIAIPATKNTNLYSNGYEWGTFCMGNCTCSLKKIK